MEILNYVKEELGKAEVTQSRGSLKVHCESLMEAELRRQEARELTEELLDHHLNGWEGLGVDERRKRVKLDKRQTQIRTVIAGFKDSLALQQQGGGGAARSAADHLMFGNLKLHTQAEATEADSAAEIVYKRESALAAEVEAALNEPMAVEDEDSPS